MRYRGSNMNVRGVGSMVTIAAGVLGCAGASEAAYVGLTVISAGDHMVNGVMRTSWRVFALCDDPGDYVYAVAGSPSLGNLVIQTRSQDGTGSGGLFVNPPGGTARAPSASVIGTELEWDTYVDIGLIVVPIGVNDLTGLSPGFPGIGSVSGINFGNAGWFTNLVPQALAGNGTADVDGLGHWGVFLAQLTVDAGNHVAGTVSIHGVNNNPLAGGTTFSTMANQTFSSFPAPGGLAVLGFAALVGSRKRVRT